MRAQIHAVLSLTQKKAIGIALDIEWIKTGLSCLAMEYLQLTQGILDQIFPETSAEIIC